ncbi:3'(2'),5'-bisphosphate nucleotidase CysQ [Desertibaculum subflavum]|uniref:3'(2'),5'-bisphosphate nucleotidase CysQ n=1 Tax=Desertibaculum subflavum TaxID=2268458 RepID=UPI000E668904
MDQKQRSELAAQLVQLAEQAGQAILEIYATDFAARAKADASPVTDADERAEAIILDGLRRLTPAIPVVAEESAAAGRAPTLTGGPFWLVDPLDGTREFVDRNGEFTVNIALIEQGRPTLGVVHAPVLGLTYWNDGAGAFGREAAGEARPIRVRQPAADGLVVLASRSHRDARTDDYLATVKVKALSYAGSSLKFCQVAEGIADHYPRIGRTMEWDTAAGHAVLAAAGGRVTTLDGRDLTYGKPGFANPDFIARGG